MSREKCTVYSLRKEVTRLQKNGLLHLWKLVQTASNSSESLADTGVSALTQNHRTESQLKKSVTTDYQ